MISLDNNRLIGDFFEANSSITYEESTNTKSFKWLVKYRAKKQRKKLLSIVEKLSKSDYVLTRDNIYELFVYLFNNADIYSKDNLKIFKPNSEETDDRIEGVIKLDNIMCLIHIDHNIEFMEITVETRSLAAEDDKNNISLSSSSKVEINRKELADPSGIAENQLKKINKFLLETIYDFIKFNIERYIEE